MPLHDGAIEAIRKQLECISIGERVSLIVIISADAVPFIRGSMTSLMASQPRDDGYGKQVRDHAVLELTARKPRVELFSVIPKGDGR